MSTAAAIRLRVNAPAGGVTVRGSTIYGAAVLTVGEAKGHGFMVDQTMLEQAAAEIRAHTVKVRLAHHDGEDVGEIIGSLSNPKIVGDTLRADVELLTSSRHYNYVLDLAQRMPTEIGLSADFQPDEFATIGGKSYGRILRLNGCDIVGKPAANPNGLLSAIGGSESMENVTQILTSWLKISPDSTEAEIAAALTAAISALPEVDDPAEPALMTAGGNTDSVALGVQLERRRMEKVASLARKLDLPAEWAADQIRLGATFEQACSNGIEERKRMDGRFAYSGRNFADVDLGVSPATERYQLHHAGNTGGGKEVAQAAVLCHLGRKDLAIKTLGTPATESAIRLGVRTASDLCHTVARTHGIDLTGRTENESIKLAFSSSSMPQALAGSLDAIVSETYVEQPATWRTWAAIKSVKSFRPHKSIRGFMANSSLEVVPPGGEIKHGTLAEEYFEFRVDTYAKMLALTRQDVQNDDLNLLADLAAEIGRQAPRAVADLLYGVVLDNVGDFYGTGHDNYLSGVTSGLGVISLTQAVMTLRQMRDAGGRLLSLSPKVLVVPPELEFAAKQLLMSVTLQRDQTEDQQPESNPWSSLAILEVEPRLSDLTFNPNASSTAWYLMGGLANPSFVVAFLDGKEQPTVETSDVQFNQLGTQMRAFIDIGAGQADFRTSIKSAGV